MKKYWTLLGWIVGIGLALYSIKERKPTFIVNPLKPLIIDKNLLKDVPISILDTLGYDINNDVSVITFYFFNQGRESIRKENILEPLAIKISEGRILDYKILKISREVTGLRFDKIDSLKQRIGIDFKILEKSDGFSGQIIVSANRDAKVLFEGTIEGVRDIKNSYTDLGQVLSTNYLLVIMTILLCVPSIYLLFFNKSKPYLSLSERLARRYQLIIRNEANLSEKSQISFTYAKIVVVAGSITLLLFVLFMLMILNEFYLKPKTRDRLQVPTEVLP